MLIAAQQRASASAAPPDAQHPISAADRTRRTNPPVAKDQRSSFRRLAWAESVGVPSLQLTPSPSAGPGFTQESRVVLNCCVTATKVVPWRSNSSTIFAKSSASGSGDRPCRQPPCRPDAGRCRQTAAAGRAFQRSAGEPAIVIGGLDQPPSLAPLAADESLASLALRVQRVEVLSNT